MARGRAEIERAIDRLDPAIRCYLFYGPDEAGSRALAARVAARVGSDAERIDLAPAALKADPALLADEAASRSLFGGARHIRVEGAGEECVAAVEALLSAPAAGNPAVLIGGALKKDARLVKCVEGDPAGLTFASWPPDAADAERLAIALAREAGLRLDKDGARRLADGCNGDRAVMAREIEKIALYADASPDAPRDAQDALFDAVGIDAAEADTARLLDALFGGDERALTRELGRAAGEDKNGIVLVRAVLRRALTMAAVRAEADRGGSADAAVGRHAFGRDRVAVARDLPRWSAARLAAMVARLGEIERLLKTSRGPGPVAADQWLLAMARTARRR